MIGAACSWPICSLCSGNEDRLKLCQKISMPMLDRFKQWLEQNAKKPCNVARSEKLSITPLNQWQYLIGYCECSDLMNSNIMAENAICLFAIGRKNWLFADTRKGPKPAPFAIR